MSVDLPEPFFPVIRILSPDLITKLSGVFQSISESVYATFIHFASNRIFPEWSGECPTDTLICFASFLCLLSCCNRVTSVLIFVFMYTFHLEAEFSALLPLAFFTMGGRLAVFPFRAD